jgi:metallophosphoesterase superfamily enzyme
MACVATWRAPCCSSIFAATLFNAEVSMMVADLHKHCHREMRRRGLQKILYTEASREIDVVAAESSVKAIER